MNNEGVYIYRDDDGYVWFQLVVAQGVVVQKRIERKDTLLDIKNMASSAYDDE